MFLKKISLIGTLLLSTHIQAALVAIPTQEISSVRAEGNVALIGFDNPADVSSGCDNRVWIALNDDIGRAKFSLALAAFASGKQVSVRADNTESTKVYTECKMYDILVSK